MVLVKVLVNEIRGVKPGGGGGGEGAQREKSRGNKDGSHRDARARSH